MSTSRIIFEHSPWYILLCLVIAAGYTTILYRKGGPWPANVNYVLSLARGILVAILSFLLIGPIVKLILTSTEKPIIVFAYDNSASLSSTEDSTALQNINRKLFQIQSAVSDEYDAFSRTLSGPVEIEEDIRYSEPATNLNEMLRSIEMDYEGRNLAKVVLVSDGIYNQGVSPGFRDYNYEIYTIGLGDTVPKQDLKLTGVYYNKIAYEGNQFPVVAEVLNEGFVGQLASVSLVRNGETVQSKQIRFSSNKQLNEIEFLVNADKQGLQRYTISVSYLEGEFLRENNTRQVFVDVVEGQENILIAASAPHPDIKAVASAIESNPNYTVTRYIHGIDEYKNEKYDLVVFIGMPDRAGTTLTIFNNIYKDAASHLFILGANTNTTRMYDTDQILKITRRGFQVDQVTGAFNPGFSDFLVSDELRDLIADLPPVTAPFGQYELTGNASVIISQMVGSIDTGRPLVAVQSEGGKRTGVIAGEGIWRWRLFEYRDKRHTRGFNEIISKMVQYLSSKEDKRKFRVYTSSEQYIGGEPVRFMTEIYNDLYEPVYGNEIELRITDAEGETQNFSYVNSASRNGYSLSGLEEGIYSFTAQSLVGGVLSTSTGEFVVEDQTVELLNLTADHELLRKLSVTSGGKFFSRSELDEMETALSVQKSAALLRSFESYEPVINLPWVFFLLLTLVSMEWLLRKYYGSY